MCVLAKKYSPENGGDDDGGDPDAGDNGGDDGMDWEGSDEGKPSFPIHTRGILEQLQDIAIHGGDDWGEGQSFQDRVGAALAGAATGIPAPAGGDTGWGDASGSEGRPTLTPPYRDGIFLGVGGAPAPTEDWGDWKDPRAMVAYIGAWIDALAHRSGAAAIALNGSALANRRIGAEMERILARNEG